MADYMVIAVDSFDGEPFPVYVTAPETTSAVVEELRKENNRAGEIYDLKSDPRSQARFQSRIWNGATKRTEMEQVITATGASATEFARRI